MIVTDRFVFLHFPKTGGIFVAETLKKLHRRIGAKRLFLAAPRCDELILPNLKRIRGASVLNPHGTYEQIPLEHRAKPIVSCIRNPFDRYVSIYEYRNWVQRLPDELEAIKEKFPDFPELTFEQFLYFINEFDVKSRTHSDRLKLDIGMMSYAFIQFFFKDPGETIARLSEEYLCSDRCRLDMADVDFLRTENLNGDLRAALVRLGYSPRDVAFVIGEKKSNVTLRRKADRKWRTYYNPELFQYVRFKERFILRLFPEYDGRFEENEG